MYVHDMTSLGVISAERKSYNAQDIVLLMTKNLQF